MEKDLRFSFAKGDLLLLHVASGDPFHLLVVHVIREGEVFYCWDLNSEVYRVVSKSKRLFLLCPEFDMEFESDLDWTNEWVLALYLRKYDLLDE